MLPTLLYCPQCERHTPHRNLPQMYATQCDNCHAITSTLMRLQAQEAGQNLQAPDGTQAIVVENNTKEVVFYVPTGPHQGYYHHNKQTGENSIAA